MGWRMPTKGPRRISVPRNAISKQKSAPPWHHHESTAPSTLTPRGSAPSPPAFPAQLLLTASGGFHSTSAADFLNWPNRVWSIGPSLAQTIFDGGSRRAKVRQSQAAYDVTVADYRQTVLTAFQQVENNLAAGILNQVIQEQDSAVGSATWTLDEASVRYHSGIDSYLKVITAQTALLNAREAALTF
jgi:outer membrane protein TolC